MKIKLTVGYLNPISPALDSSHYPHARALQTSIHEKFFDTVEVFASLFLYLTGGIFILNAYLRTLCETILMAPEPNNESNEPYVPPSSTKRFFANIFYYPLKAIDIIASSLQIIFGIVLAIACLPFIAIAHGISRLVRSSLKNTAGSLKVAPLHNTKTFPHLPEWQPQSSTVMLGKLLSSYNEKISSVDIEEVERVNDNEFKIYTEFEANKLPASPTVRAMAIVDRQNPHIHALAKLNILTCFALEKANYFESENNNHSQPASGF